MKNFIEYDDSQVVAISDVDSKKVDFFSRQAGGKAP